MILNVYDYNATEEIEYDNFKVYPIDKTEYNGTSVISNSIFGIMRSVSILFRKRHNNIVLITLSEDAKTTAINRFPLQISEILSAFQSIIDVYGVQLNTLIITDILKYIDEKDSLIHLNFFSLDELIPYRKDDKDLMIYLNDLGGNKILALAKLNEG